MQTILGSGGAIGIPLAKELRKYTDSIQPNMDILYFFRKWTGVDSINQIAEALNVKPRNFILSKTMIALT